MKNVELKNKSDLDLQHDYAEKLAAKGDAAFTLVAAEAFIRGMRDSGYKSTATAIDEFIDNSIQAEASRVDVLYGEAEIKRNKRTVTTLSHIAVVDDGHGMEPNMLRASVLWGGTHRENNRDSLGRYGFGLPSAAVSITEHYQVYSKVKDNDWHCVDVNLPDIAAGKYTDEDGSVIAPKPYKATLPDYISEDLKAQERNLESGTIILILQPDRLSSGYTRASSFSQKIMEHLGLIYRGWLRHTDIYVNNKKVECVDPLFITEGCRYYDIGNKYKAEALPPHIITVKTEDGEKEGNIRIRYSYMPPQFQLSEPGKSKATHKGRFNIMKQMNSFFIVCRAGRQIDLVTKTIDEKPWDTFKNLNNYDRNWAIELDFDPVLDEEFGVTVNKQQIVLKNRIWDILGNEEVGAVIKTMRAKFTTERNKDERERKETENKEQKKEAEQIMDEAHKFKSKSVKAKNKKTGKADDLVQDDIDKKVNETGKTPEEVAKEIIDSINNSKYKVQYEGLEGAPFYRPEKYGSQLRLWINMKHKFYTEIYNAPNTTQKLKTAIELLLFTLASCEVDANEDRELFYERERAEWSKELTLLLNLFERVYEDIEERVDEEEEVLS